MNASPATDAPYTTAPIGRTMLRTAAAMLAGTLALSGYNVVDTYFVGRLGTIPLAAMGFTFPVVMLFGCVFRGIATGIMTTSAQALGAGDRPRAANIISVGLLLVVLVSAAIAAAGMATARPLFELCGASGEVLPEVTGYMDVWYFGCVTASLSMTGNDLLIASGHARTTATMMVLGLVLNALLDPLFIFGLGSLPPLGIRGAALATVLSQAVSTLAVLSLLRFRHRLVVLPRLSFRSVRAIVALVARYAIPGTLGMITMPLGSAVLTWITARFGDAAVAAVAAAGRLEMLAFTFPMALGMSIVPMVAQNYGARLHDRIRTCFRFSTGFAFFYLLGMAVIFTATAPWIVRPFSDDPEVRRIMVLCLRIVSWAFPAQEIHRFCGFFQLGTGHPTIAAWLNAGRILFLLLPFSFLALLSHRLPALFAARTCADVLACLIALLLARRLLSRLRP